MINQNENVNSNANQKENKRENQKKTEYRGFLAIFMLVLSTMFLVISWALFLVLSFAKALAKIPFKRKFGKEKNKLKEIKKKLKE